jgi:TRAP-type C4-dicarboxylate transport system permease small subunit
VDILVTRLSKRQQQVFDLANFIGSIVILGLIAWNSFGQGLEMMRSGQVSATFSIPVYLFMFIVSIGSIAMALEVLKDLIRHSVELIKS